MVVPVDDNPSGKVLHKLSPLAHSSQVQIWYKKKHLAIDIFSLPCKGKSFFFYYWKTMPNYDYFHAVTLLKQLPSESDFYLPESAT